LPCRDNVPEVCVLAPEYERTRTGWLDKEVRDPTDFADAAAARCCRNRERRAETLKALRPLGERCETSALRVNGTTAARGAAAAVTAVEED
jgi:hypothetical protein